VQNCSLAHTTARSKYYAYTIIRHIAYGNRIL
jgi:hypothetical protein